MNKRLLRTGLLSLALTMSFLSAKAEKYVIYPIPQSVTMSDGTLALTPQVRVIYESGIDQATRNRLEALLTGHGMTVSADADETVCTTIRLGMVNSGEAVEQHAWDVLSLSKTRIMVGKKFDRHALSVSQQGITILGEHTNAVFCALASLEQMLEQQSDGALEYATIYDHADQQNRGLVEGYYGYPYSVEVKKELMRYMMRYKMNTYMYGAKSDPYHSQMWEDAYPTTITAEQEKNGWLTQKMIRELAQVSEDTKVNFIWAIHPGNEFLGSSTVISDIMSKFQKMHSLGVRQFGVFVDDVSVPSSDSDMALNAERLSALQTAIEEKWNVDGVAATDTVRPLHFVPQIYCNSFASSVDQRQRFMSALGKVQDYITVYSTGQGVWSVPNNSHTTTIVDEFGRSMSWWWNYPCNDNADGQLYPMDMYSNFVDMPSVGNSERMPSTLSNCQGIVANPMQQGSMARTSLFSIADYAWNNTAFNNSESWEASFQSLIEDETVRQAYHDITYYLRWNEPESLQTLINSYKTSLEAGTPASAELKATVLEIKANCELVKTLKDSSVKSDRLLYNDIAPWLHTLHTYTIVTEKMLGILDTPTSELKSQWLNVKAVADSLYALEHSTLYTAYALEGMGNGISVSYRQAQLSRKYWYPFISYLKTKAIDPYFHDATAITESTAISNSPLLKASVSTQGGTVSLTLKPSDLDTDKYVGVALPTPTLVEGVEVAESLLPLVRYSQDGKVWNSVTEASELSQKYIAYLILLNESGTGISNFSLNDGDLSISLPVQAQVADITLPSGSIYESHTGDLMIDGDYDTYTCLNRTQAQGDIYLLDLGKTTTIHDVRLCMGLTNGDYPTACVVQVSGSGSAWTTLKVKGTTTSSWKKDLEQNVQYSDAMVYCDFDGAGRSARYVRLRITTPNTSKWLRIHELEVNRQHAENSTLAACTDGSGNALESLTDGDAITGLPAEATSPLTYSLNRLNDVRAITYYGLQNGGAQATISITLDGTEWQSIGTLTEACQTVDLQAYPKARAIRLEWQEGTAPAVYEIMADYDLSTSSLPNSDTDLSLAFAKLKAKALAALDSCGQYEKLITQNSQFSSPYTESKEGSINNLLDGSLSTFWHSAWSSGNVSDGTHYLEIALPEGTQGDVVMHYGRRSSSTTHQLVSARIQGVVSGSGTSAQTEDITDLDLPYASNTETLIRQFNLPKAYSSIRLLELKTNGTNGNNSAGFFHIGDMQLYSTAPHYIIRNAQAEADALLAATAPMPSTATESDLQKLKEAYDAFMYKVFDVPTDVTDIPADDITTGKPTIYDVTGRRVSKPTHGGVYIVNGKKTVMK